MCVAHELDNGSDSFLSRFYFKTRKRSTFTGEAVTWVFLLFETFMFSFHTVCWMTGNDKLLSVYMGNKNRLTEVDKLPKLQET